MIKYKGLIYEKAFQQLKNVELHVNIFSRGTFCDHLALYWGRNLRRNLWSFFELTVDLYRDHGAQLAGKNWEVVVKALGQGGGHGQRFLEVVLEPFTDSLARYLVKDGKLSMRLQGRFAKNWTGVFRGFRELPGFTTDKLVEVEIGRDIPRWLLEEYFYEEFDYDDGWL